jgi:hypothetical protein
MSNTANELKLKRLRESERQIIECDLMNMAEEWLYEQIRNHTTCPVKTEL